MSEERLTAEERAAGIGLTHRLDAYAAMVQPHDESLAGLLGEAQDFIAKALRLSVSGLSEQEREALEWARDCAALTANAQQWPAAMGLFRRRSETLRALLERMGG